MSRNNQNRFGATPEGNEVAQKTNPLNFVTPTEFVELPSRGRGYPESHPLNGQETIEINYMTAKDEDILSSEALLKKGLAIERFIENIIVNKQIVASSLMTGDRNAIIIAARSSGYGNAYETKITCPSCGAKDNHVFDLDKPKIKESKTNEEYNLVLKDNMFATVMPLCKLNITFRLLTGKDELEMMQKKLKKQKTKVKGLEKNITEQYKRIITSVEGFSDQPTINRFVDCMLSGDSYHLKRCYKEAAPDVEIKENFECHSCGHEQEMEVPLGADFFWPDV